MTEHLLISNKLLTCSVGIKLIVLYTSRSGR